MADFLLVDGYNVIGAWPELAALKEKSLEHAREKLADILAGYGAYKEYRVVIVFDAGRVAGAGPRTAEVARGLLGDVLAAKQAMRDGHVESGRKRRRQELDGRLVPDVAGRLDAWRRGR